MRNMVADFLLCGADGSEGYHLMGLGFLSVNENSNAQAEKRAFISDRAASSVIRGYETQFPFANDKFMSEPAVAKLYDVARNQKRGAAAVTKYCRVEAFLPTGIKDVHPAREFRVAIEVADITGEGTQHMKMSGSLNPVGDFTPGVFDIAAKTFHPGKDDGKGAVVVDYGGKQIRLWDGLFADFGHVPPGTPPAIPKCGGANVGEIFWWPLETPPDGALWCDGRTVSRTEYADLFEVIGTGFGAGDGETTFCLPDMRGQFVRGHDPSAHRDPAGATRGLGSAQAATLVTDVYSWRGTSGAAAQLFCMLPAPSANNTLITSSSFDGMVGMGVRMTMNAQSAITSPGSSRQVRVRPTNINLLPCIRHRADAPAAAVSPFGAASIELLDAHIMQAVEGCLAAKKPARKKAAAKKEED